MTAQPLTLPELERLLEGADAPEPERGNSIKWNEWAGAFSILHAALVSDARARVAAGKAGGE